MFLDDIALWWQPIVAGFDPADKDNWLDDSGHWAHHPVVACQIQLRHKQGMDLDTWWAQQRAQGTLDQAQGQMEVCLIPHMRAMARAHRWHIPLQPGTLPMVRDLYTAWPAEFQALQYQWVYDVPVDDPPNADLLRELLQIRNQWDQDGWPMLAGVHVGRGEPLSRALAERLNQEDWGVLFLDPSVIDTLTYADFRHPGHNPDLDGLWTFMQAVRPDLPVVATGLTRVDQWHTVRACMIRYVQGPLYMPPHSLDLFPAGGLGDISEDIAIPANDAVAQYGLHFCAHR